MDIQSALREMTERLGATASVKSVYGDPVTAGNRTVIPVAKLWYSFGAGGGKGRGGSDGPGGGGGGGGSVYARPAGALEITETQTRFIGFHDWRVLGIAMAAGFLIGSAVAAVSTAKTATALRKYR